MKLLPLEEIYTKFAPLAGAASGALLPPGMQREVGHFNVFNVADLMLGYRDKPTWRTSVISSSVRRHWFLVLSADRAIV